MHGFEIQYGGKITDDLDRRLFNTYAEIWLCPTAVSEGFSFNPERCIEQIPDGFEYKVPCFKSTCHSEFVSCFRKSTLQNCQDYTLMLT